MSQFYSFTTLKSGSDNSRDFTSIQPTLLSSTEANLKVTVPSQYMKSYGYYWGTDLKNLQKYVIEDNINKEVSEFTCAPKNLTPDTSYYFSVYSFKKKTMDVEWIADEDAVDGYQIQYATDKKFKFAKNITITSWLTEEKRITKLKSKKKYYVRIRTYINSAEGKKYGKWSKVKSCKVK